MTKNKFRFVIFVLQISVVFLLYFLLPGLVSLKKTAFQPDSINSICMSMNMFHLAPELMQNILREISNQFTPHHGMTCNTFITPPYRTRILLPLVIGPFLHLGIWWAIFIPNIIIYLLLGQLYCKLLGQFIDSRKNFWLIALLPFISLHITGFFADFMTEGLVAICLLGMAFFWLGDKKHSTLSVITFPLIFGIFAIFTKQVWPIVAITWIVIIHVNFVVKKLRFILSLLAFLLAYTASLLTNMIGGHLYGSDFGNWSVFAIFRHPYKALYGNILNIEHNIINCFTNFDPAFFIVVYILLLTLKSREVLLTKKIIILGMIFWGLAVSAETYIVEADRGDNWRFLSFGLFFVVPVFLSSNITIRFHTGISRKSANTPSRSV